MKKLDIIVCNDGRVPGIDEALQAARKQGLSGDALRVYVCEKINLDGSLCRHLRGQGHNVTLFDGYSGSNFKTQIKDAVRLANEIAALIIAKEATCMTLDLNWFKDFQMGIEILRNLRRLKVIPVDMKDRILIYSRYTNDPSFNYEEILTKELGVRKENILNRNGVNITTVAEIIQKWAD